MSDYEFYKDKPKPKNHLCGAAIIMRDGKVLMGLREYDKGKPLWTFPGGRCDEGEQPADAVKREAAEEIGVSDLVIEEVLGEKDGAYTRPDGITDRVTIFQCSTKQEPRNMEPQKFLEWRWMDPDDLPENLIDQKDRDFLKTDISK